MSELILVAATIVTAFVGLYTAMSNRRKTDSEAVTNIINAASKAVELRDGDISLLEESLRMDALYRQYIDKGIIRLLKQLHDVDITPVFIPIPYEEFIRRMKEGKKHGRNK